MSPTSTIAAGSTGVLAIAADNANGATGNFPSDITDSVGNSWHLWADNAPSGTNTSVEIAIYVCAGLTTQLTSSNNVTATYTVANVTAKAWTFTELTPTSGNVVIVGGAIKNTAGAAVTSQSLASQDVLSIGNAVIGVCGIEGADSFTGDSDTTNGSWSAQQHTGTGTGTTGMSITTQGKIQTTTNSAQTYDVTFTSADTDTSVATFREVASACRGLLGAPANSATTWVVTFARPLAVGSMGVFCIAAPNSGLNGATKVCPNSITDTSGNVWTQQLTAIYDPSGAGAGSELAIYTAPITTNLATGATMTVTWDAAVSLGVKLGCIYEFVPNPGNAFAFISSGSGTAAASAAPTVTSGSLNSGDIIIGLLSAEDLDTSVADSDTSNGSWSTMQAAGTGITAGSDQAISSQYKITTGAGTQTYNPTLTSADVIIGYASIRQSLTQSATNGFFQ